MNISFKGTTNHYSEFGQGEIQGQEGFYHTLTCTLNNEGKRKDLYEFGPILQEFPHSKIKSENNVLQIQVFNKLGPEDSVNIQESLEKFFAEKYNPQGDLILINGKPLAVGKNKLYIVEKIQNLAKTISEKRNAEFVNSKNGFDNPVKVKNIKFNADVIYKSAKNLIKRYAKY